MSHIHLCAKHKHVLNSPAVIVRIPLLRGVVFTPCRVVAEVDSTWVIGHCIQFVHSTCKNGGGALHSFVHGKCIYTCTCTHGQVYTYMYVLCVHTYIYMLSFPQCDNNVTTGIVILYQESLVLLTVWLLHHHYWCIWRDLECEGSWQLCPAWSDAHRQRIVSSLAIDCQG